MDRHAKRRRRRSKKGAPNEFVQLVASLRSAQQSGAREPLVSEILLRVTGSINDDVRIGRASNGAPRRQMASCVQILRFGH